MRCPDCNKFVRYDDPAPEIEDEQIDDGVLTASVRIPLNCGDCGTELKEARVEFETEIEHKCIPEPGKELPPELEEGDEQYEIVSSDANGNERSGESGRKGFHKHYYGADLTFDVRCNRCDETFQVEGLVEEQASYFDEIA